ncbi:pyruvate dehydrogenase complex dihydrolipoamide acetyltransferase [Polymorphobacter sp. PAMC 29334]|uniref:pyruvate dehydrogenase complex dihydrolipoamide acetyltransferase n=1 Tax=Polymorphobacter sp. PAMC 29334 TaxID=2862331 RepID=UPI001C74E431|nr:pyruvate dehydrogenase complex dihydrolipoamide acetyltransferase [Polymorphobacter sp. PAMC 29334]QYE34231.1 pyruvate dehydrogenase complex dihydrolipoamide acetyltransferase [Polymorphobacter sp. PAMC 29334]
MIDITMPALSPTMETGTLAKWLVKVGDVVKSGDILCEIETDKATMEVESIDEGTVAELLVAEGADAIPVGQVIARLTAEGEEAAPAKAAPTLKANNPPPSSGEGDRAVSGVVEGASQAPKPSLAPAPTDAKAAPEPAAPSTVAKSDGPPPPKSGEDQGAPAKTDGTRVNASPLARRLASAQGIDLSTVTGSGPHGRIVKADLDGAIAKPAGRPVAAPSAAPAAEAKPATAPAPAAPASAAAAPSYPPPAGVPAEAIKLSNMRKTIARRLAESKQTVPHFYLTVDVRLDALLKLRGDLNKSLEASGVKLSVNDLLIKALGLALVAVPDSNVQFAGDTLYKFGRADVSVAVAIPGGLITPIIADAANKRLSVIATEMKDLAARAKDGKLKPEEYTGGTASISNLGMFGIKQFDAVINPPQGLILAVGAGEKRPYVVDDALAIATVMSATGSFDHRAIDGAVGAQFMSAFKALVESPMSMLA